MNDSCLNPSFNTVTTQFNTRVLIVEQGARREEMPEEFAGLIGELYWQALAAPRECFAKLAERARLPSLKLLLERMAERDFCRVYAAIVDNSQNAQTDVYMQGGWPPRGFAFRLAQEKLPEWLAGRLPDPLANVYEIFDGTLEQGPDAACGFQPHFQLLFNFEIPSADDVPISDPCNALTFYSTDTGDQLVAEGEQAYWYRHERGDFVPAGKLEELIDRYFAFQFDQRTQWAPNPYH